MAETFDFSQPLTLSLTEAPGVWYTDRSAPAGFVSQATAPDSTANTLEESIDGSQQPSDSFSQTQGRGYDLAPGDTIATVSLYVSSAWATSGQPAAGFWSVGTDGSDNIPQDYPIIEYLGANTNVADPGYCVTPTPTCASSINAAGFYGYNDIDGTWQFITAGTDGWNSLTMALTGSGVEYTVDGTSIADVSSGSSVQLSEVMLEGYNNGSSGLGSYDVYWNGLSAATTPEPGTVSTMFGGMALLLLVGVRSRRKASHSN